MFKKRTLIKNVLLFVIVGTTLILCAEGSQAATYYVSNSGTASWSQCTNINTPCTVQTAFDNAAAGDIVNFRGGTYAVPPKNFGDSYQSYYQPANSGTASNPITFQAYNTEVPLFNGKSGGSGDLDGTNGYIICTIMGVYQKAYVVFSGFHFQCDNGVNMARMHLGGNDELAPPYSTNYITVNNCDFNGGSNIHTGTDNAEGLRLDSVGYVTVTNNRIYNYRETNDYHNTSAFKEYNTIGTTISNNEIYNSSNGLYLKRDCTNCVISYNFIHDNAAAIYLSGYTNPPTYNQRNGKIFHNVIINFSQGIFLDIEDLSDSNTYSIYNNTFYTSGTPMEAFITVGLGTDHHVYNNIFLVPHAPTDYSGAVLRHNTGSIIAEQDYNNFGNTNFQIRGPSGTYYSSLSSWKTSTEMLSGLNPDTHSLASDPKFTNGSGTLSRLSDFTLASNSPSKGTGKGGGDMGANAANVGPGGTVKTIQPPTNLRVQ